MQPEKNPSFSPPVFSSAILELLKQHYGWISTIVAALGVVNLAIYTHHIGRSDVFMASLELGPGLVLLCLAHLFFFAMLIGSMMITSLVLSGGLNALRPKPECAASIVRSLTGIAALAMLSVVIPIGVSAWRDETASPWWALAAFLVPALRSWFFLRKNIGSAELLTGNLKSWRMFCACALLTMMLGITALVAIYPALFVTKFYEERGVMGGWGEGLFFCLVAMLGSLAPAIGYYDQLAKGKVAQVKGALAGVAIFTTVLMLMVPSLLIVPSVVAAKFLGITDRQVKRYLIVNEEYPAESLDASRWLITRSQEKRYVLQGFSLYANGPIVLLCPAGLAKLNESELDKYTAQCIPFAKNAVKALDSGDADSAVTQHSSEGG